jgi:[ribosomal protein S5]-alanine N-acetyltransferase
MASRMTGFASVQPILETSRLRLRPAAEADLDELLALWVDPQVRRFLWDDVIIERDQAHDTIRSFADLAPRGLGLWAILRRAQSGDLIGCAALSPVGTAADYYPPIAAAVEPLIALMPEMWSHGYAAEALTALVHHATTTLGLDRERVVAVTDLPNVASDRLLRRVGFVLCAETDGPRYRLRHYRLEGEPLRTAAPR